MKLQFLSYLNPNLLKVVKAVGRCADKDSICAYLVGGTVRDLILKKRNVDLDIVLEGDAVAIAKIFAVNWNVKVTTYPVFGTATLILENGLRLDLSSTRKEEYVFSGALPKVERSQLRDDLYRRDFTINAMAVGINQNQVGKLIDPFGGMGDLRQMKVNVLHKQSFVDDPTRILRAIRFEQRFGFRLGLGTSKLMKDAIKNNYFDRVKPARNFVEFRKFFVEPDPVKLIKRAKQLGILKSLFNMKGNDDVDIQLLKRIYSKFKNYSRPAPEYENKMSIYLLGLFKKFTEKTRSAILVRYPFKSEEKMSILQSRKASDIITFLSRPRISASEVYTQLYPLKLDVVEFIALLSNSIVVKRKIDRFLSLDRLVKLNIGGIDLQKLGLRDGEKMGQVLRKILFSKIDGQVKSKREELALAQKLIAIR